MYRFFGIILLLIAAAQPTIAEEPPKELMWAPKMWLESADCARSTGKVLVLCRNGGTIPLANSDPGDDPGHALVFDVYSALTGNAVGSSDILRLNSMINLGGLLLLALLLIRLWLPVAAVVALGFGAYAASLYQYPLPHAAQIGIVCLAAILPLAWLGLPLIGASRREQAGWACLGLLCLIAASFFRQSIGMMGVLVGIFAIGARFIFLRRSITPALALLVGLFLAYQSPSAVFVARDAAYGLPPAVGAERHGPWHSLFIGLGAVANPFGIEWLDDSAFARAHKVAPEVGLVTNAYFDVMRGEYLAIVREHPMIVAGIYWQKLNLALVSSLPAFPQQLTIFRALLIVLLGAAIILCMRRGRRLAAADALLVISLIFASLFLVQGALIHFKMIYLFPIEIFIALAAAALVDFIWAAKRRRSSDLQRRLPLDSMLTIDAEIHEAVMALPPDQRRDREKVNQAVRDGAPKATE